MARARSIESRILSAVLLVGAGCRPAAEPPNPALPEVMPTASAETLPVAAPEPAPTASAAPVAKAMSPEDARALCDTYKAKSDVKGRPVKSIPGVRDYDREPTDSAVWNAAADTAQCWIVRERTRTTFERVDSAPCCPQGRGNRPCPPPVKRTVPGERVVMERAEVRRDGSVVTSDVTAHERDPHPYPRHNCGRRPEGFSAGRDSEIGLGAELAAMATLEAASVPAFERLARELEHHGAPPSLVRRAKRARRDEIRHAREMTKLAREHGHVPRSFDAAPLTIRAPLAIARENAAEGCVLEAFGAVLATFQATRASTGLRPTLEAIARDERRHAALAEDVDAWILSRLSTHERAEVQSARHEAIAALRARLPTMVPCATLGTPTPDAARALFEAYFDAA